jgi:predicted DNA-binding transcriptional regulator AlpA
MMKQYRYRDLAGLGIPYTRTHLKTLAGRGTFPQPTKLMNGTLVWDLADIDAWLEARTQEVAA